MQLAARTRRIGASATMEVSRRAAELRDAGVNVIDFGAGEPDFASPAAAVETARQALTDGFTKYTPLAGIPELRRAVAESYQTRYGAPWVENEVLITVGAKAALFELALALFEEGDEVIIPSPCWLSFPEQVRFTGAQPVLVSTSVEDGFRVHAEPILAAVGESTRGIIVNSPANPTGGVLEAADLERIVEAAASRGIVVIADETYERFLYDGQTHASAATLAKDYPQTIVVVGSFSKTYAMTGWRVGFVLGPKEILTAVGNIQSHATSNVTSFAMVGALAALRGAEADVEAMVAEYQARRDLVLDRLNALPGVRCGPPAGAFYAFPHVARCYRPGREGSAALARFLLEEVHVAVVPGAFFGNDQHIRLSFACSRQDLHEGLDRMAGVL